uniref:Uncharacterized protein n=1 Tax=Parascaris equorum TaxID=6256 RepID=A0A914RT90_PAREQ
MLTVSKHSMNNKSLNERVRMKREHHVVQCKLRLAQFASDSNAVAA